LLNRWALGKGLLRGARAGLLVAILVAVGSPALAISTSRTEAESLASFCANYKESGEGKASGERWLESELNGATCVFDFDVPIDFAGFLVAGAWTNDKPGSVAVTVDGVTQSFTPGQGKGLYSLRFGPLAPGSYTATLVADNGLGWDFLSTDLELAAVSISNSGDISFTSAESAGFMASQLLGAITLGAVTGYVLWGRSS
jgi:hypothetical protein